MYNLEKVVIHNNFIFFIKKPHARRGESFRGFNGL
jgi:hypothetical protein